MEECLGLGHMEEVIDEDQIPKRAFYLPHHAVIKESSLTTIRSALYLMRLQGVRLVSHSMMC